MMSGDRSLSPSNIKAISGKLQIARTEFLNRVESAVGETTLFSMSVANAIGEISTDEAEQGIIEFFTEQMRKRKI